MRRGPVQNRTVPLQRQQTLSTAASVFHYAPEIFEGMKAYRREDGSVHLFRPALNAQRFAASAERIALPQLAEADFLKAVQLLVDADRDWVPSAAEHSLYLRPFMFANEPYFGVRATQQAEFHVIASPAGSYFTRGPKPLSLWVEGHYARASSRGTGAAKFGGNYAASALPQRLAHERGYDQVLFLDAETSTKVDEAGSMNVFLLAADNTLITPQLSGAILDGITRRSVMQLALDRNLRVQERTIERSELFEGVRSGHIVEAFATGTAAVVTPIGRFTSEDESAELPKFADPLSLSLRRELTDIQWGRIADRHGWCLEVSPSR